MSIISKIDKIIEDSGIDALEGCSLKDICKSDKFTLKHTFQIINDNIYEYERKY